MFTWAAAFTASQIKISDSSKNSLVASLGFAMTSTAPYSNALNVNSAELVVRLEITTTGTG